MSSIYKYLRTLADKEHYTVKILLLVIFVISVALMFPVGKSSPQEYEIGEIWTEEDLVASLSFPIYKTDEEYKKDCENALKNLYDIYKINQQVSKNKIDSLQIFFSEINNLSEKDIANLIMLYELNLNQNEIEILSKSNKWQLSKTITNFLNEIYLKGIVENKIDTSKMIVLRVGFNEELIPPNEFYDLNQIQQKSEKYFSNKYFNQNELKVIAIKIAISFSKPNVNFQEKETLAERKSILSGISITNGAVSKGEKIILTNEKISTETIRKLRAYQKLMYEKMDNLEVVISFGGKILFVFLLVSLFLTYLFFFERKIFLDNTKILLILLIIFFECLIAFLIVQLELPRAYRFLIPLPVVGLLMTILFSTYVGFLSSVLASFLVSGILGNDYAMLLQMLVGGALGVISIRDITERTQIFRSIIFLFSGFGILLIIHSMMLNSEISVASVSIFFSGINSVFSSIITYAIVILLEKKFSFSTNFVLIEFDNLNHPILKKLAAKASGTFHHSVTMGTLANDAANAIDADSTLARVGAYYHDIGKMQNPTAFIENQIGKKYKPEKINPLSKARAIKNHIENGMNIAREEKLPQSIIDFIPMHHGTRFIGSFYEMALQSKRAEQKINISDFKYSGPRPNSKETAIVMLADAIEASTRALKNPTLKSIEENIEKIFEERLREGELDETPLTIRDLAKIKASFLKVLVGFHHSRIVSPSKFSAKK